VPEAQLEDFGSGLAPVTRGWFVVNVRDAEWFSSDTRGAACWFESEYGDPPIEFAQLGINLAVLEAGQSSMYHAEANQEAFLVLAGECTLIVEENERRLVAWDFFYCAPETEHIIVASEQQSAIVLAVGARGRGVGGGLVYTTCKAAARYGASVARETTDSAIAYAKIHAVLPRSRFVKYRRGWLRETD